MRLVSTFLATAAVLALALPTASQALDIYSINLSGPNESPANTSPGTGSGTITFDMSASTMRVEVTFTGLLSNVTNAHIHCCTAVAGASTTGVATVTPTFTLFPAGATFGTYDRTFNMTAATGSWNNAFVTANGGTTATAFAALTTGAAAGKAYFNIHTSNFPGGEIRGFLAPVPEPETYALMLGGLGLLAVAARRRQRT